MEYLLFRGLCQPGQIALRVLTCIQASRGCLLVYIMEIVMFGIMLLKHLSNHLKLQIYQVSKTIQGKSNKLILPEKYF